MHKPIAGFVAVLFTACLGTSPTMAECFVIGRFSDCRPMIPQDELKFCVYEIVAVVPPGCCGADIGDEIVSTVLCPNDTCEAFRVFSCKGPGPGPEQPDPDPVVSLLCCLDVAGPLGCGVAPALQCLLNGYLPAGGACAMADADMNGLDDACEPPPNCPNGVIDPGEQCDPPGNLLHCPGGALCLNNCTCPPTPFCGDNMVNQPSEECDGPDDALCPGMCTPQCRCPPPIPTMSEWGVAGMILLVLAGGTLVFRKVRGAAA